MGMKEIIILFMLFAVLMAFMASLLYFLFNYDKIEADILKKREEVKEDNNNEGDA